VSGLLAPTGITSRNEEPTYFAAGDETLFGLFTVPPGGAVDSALVMVPGAERLGYRNRLGVMVSHRLAARGHQVFRFNYRGCGESTGRAGRFTLENLFTEDAVAAAAWLRGRGVRRFLYAGSCFGARTALAAAAEDPDAGGVIVAAMPISAEQSEQERRARRTAATPMSWLAGLALRPKTLRGLRDPDRRRTYAEAFRNKMHRSRPHRAASGASDVNPELLGSLTTVIERRVPVLFVYGEDDPAYREFLQARNGAFGRLLERAGDAVEVGLAPGVLHDWASIPAGEAAVDHMVDWVSRVDRPTPVP
jgi:pimeloyl-ACP methyl ester carboxylesterase